jgi:hypothetical protein
MNSSVGSKRGFDSETYMRIGHDQLVTLALKFVLDDGKTPTFENIVEEAFLNFPERFAIHGRPDWPNALVVDRSLRRCCTNRDKKWIAGSVTDGFRLMPAGETIVTDTLQKLRGEKPLSPSLPKGGKHTASGRVVKHVESSAAFLKFRRDGNFDSVTEYDLCDLLYCTVESTPETLHNNFRVVVSNVNDFERADLLPFLTGLRRKFSHRFPMGSGIVESGKRRTN